MDRETRESVYFILTVVGIVAVMVMLLALISR